MNHAKKSWKISYSIGVPTRPGRYGGGIHVPLPGPGGRLNYLHTLRPAILAKKGWRASLDLTLGVIITLSDDALLANADPNDTATRPADLRPFVMKDLYGANDRWWSSQSIPIVAGSHSITVPLAPDQWTNVFGKSAASTNERRAAFKDMFEDQVHIGVTGGMGSHYGHGFYLAEGTGSLIIHTLSL